MKTELIGISAAAGMAALSALSPGAQAQSADAIIDKLVDKGILTLEEAKELRSEADEEFSGAYQVKSGMPDWVTSLGINGDLRGRFEGFYAKNSAFIERTRFRYRARFGLTAVLKDSFEVGIRLGTGNLKDVQGLKVGSDPISNNDTFSNNASKKGIFVDQAYATWSPINTSVANASFTLGKMENPYEFSPLVFDSDYTPEGFAAQSDFHINDQHVASLTATALILDELGSSTSDPWLFGAQARWGAEWSDPLSTSVGLAGLAITGAENLTHDAVPNVGAGNSRVLNANGDAVLTEDYTPIIADASITYAVPEVPLYPGEFPITLSGYYMHNPGADDDNQGWSVGVRFGKAGKKGRWDVSYEYRYLESDVWYEEVVDSDFGAYYAAEYRNAGFSGYGSGTNARGHVGEIRYSPFDSLTLAGKAFFTELINEPIVPAGTDPVSDMIRLQVDAAWKF